MTREEAKGILEYTESNVLDERLCDALKLAIEALEEKPRGKCNQCRYYEGVHDVLGHAPCSWWETGSVLWNDYCSRFEERR